MGNDEREREREKEREGQLSFWRKSINSFRQVIKDLLLFGGDMLALGAWRMGLGCSAEILPLLPPPSSPGPF